MHIATSGQLSLPGLSFWESTFSALVLPPRVSVDGVWRGFSSHLVLPGVYVDAGSTSLRLHASEADSRQARDELADISRRARPSGHLPCRIVKLLIRVFHLVPWGADIRVLLACSQDRLGIHESICCYGPPHHTKRPLV
jgi:hypothetical protein